MAAASHRLAVVMFTDLVGYTARSQHDEPQALRFLEEHRRLLRPMFEEHRGREVKTIGDAFLVEFDSAINAAGCAVAIPRALYERNLKGSGEAIDLRIGIHLGEVSHDNGDIHGDAVNVASRIYPLADPGGICLSEPVYTQIRGKLELSVEKLPPTPLKNVSYPVDLFRALLPWSERGLSAVLPWTDRETELDTVQKALGAAVRGEAAVVMLTGEVGIGKTRLADEVLERAKRSGTRVLRGRCLPGDLAAPYTPWIEAFRQFVNDAPIPVLYRVLGQNAREVARLVPELVEKIGTLPPAPGGEPELARFQFLEGIGQFVERLSAEGPLALFLDDLHWADPSSTLLLRYLCPRLRKHPVLLLGAYRRTEEEENREFREAMAELHRERLVSTVPLGRFDAAQVGQLIGEMFHTPEVSQEFRELVHSRTGGNPLLVEEVLRALVRDRVIYWAGAGWERRPVDQIEIPEGVKEIILQRLRRFDEKSVDLLRLASVIGYEFDFELLLQISGEEESRMLDTIESLLRGRLIQEVPAAHGRSIYLFADHPTRDVLYDQVSLVRRRRLHLKIAQAIEKLGEKAARTRAPELAHHYLEGSDVPKAREFSVLAGQQAAAVFAHAESYRHFRTAFELAEEEGDDEAKASALHRMGLEAVQLGRSKDSLKALREAAALYGRLGKPAEQSAALSTAATIARESLGDLEGALRMAREAVAILEQSPESPGTAGTLVGLGTILLSAGRTEESRTVLERALALARTYSDVDAEATSLQFLANSLPWSRKEEALAQAAKAARIAEEGNAQRTATKLVNYGFGVALLRGDPRSAIEVMERGRKAAEKRGQLQYIGFARGAAAGFLWQVGRVKEAREEAEGVLALPADEAVSMNRGLALTALASLEALSGAYPRAKELSAELRRVAMGTGNPHMVVSCDRILLDRAADEGVSDPDTESNLELVLSGWLQANRGISTAGLHGRALMAVGEAWLRQGGKDVAPLLAELETLARDLDEPWARALRDQLRGLLLLRQGQPAEAIELFCSASDVWKRIPLPYDEAKSTEWLGTALAAAGRNADARSAYDRSLELLEGLGARARSARVRALRDAVAA